MRGLVVSMTPNKATLPEIPKCGKTMNGLTMLRLGSLHRKMTELNTAKTMRRRQ